MRFSEAIDILNEMNQEVRSTPLQGQDPKLLAQRSQALEIAIGGLQAHQKEIDRIVAGNE